MSEWVRKPLGACGGMCRKPCLRHRSAGFATGASSPLPRELHAGERPGSRNEQESLRVFLRSNMALPPKLLIQGTLPGKQCRLCVGRMPIMANTFFRKFLYGYKLYYATSARVSTHSVTTTGEMARTPFIPRKQVTCQCNLGLCKCKPKLQPTPRL